MLPEPSAILVYPSERRSPLPAPLTSLVGRDRDVESVRRLLSRQNVRLLTMSGPGGVGKTTLALAVASGLVDDFPGGVTFVGLAAVRLPDLVLGGIAQAIGVRQSSDRSLVDDVIAVLEHGRRLLVLDNFEHVLTAAPLVTDLLVACPDLRVLVTSRSRLRLSGEHDVPVGPLALPDRPTAADDRSAPAVGPDVAATEQAPAVRLFVERARAVDPDFALTPTNAHAIAEICRRVDGLPLAIELAAARTRILSPPALLARLTHRLHLLTDGPRDAPLRLRSVREAIAWSHDLLTADERAVFRRLAVFAGGFTLEVAERVAAEVPSDDGGPRLGTRASELGTPPVLGLLAALVDASLVWRASTANGELRFGLLETIREFAAEQLPAAGEGEALRRRHADAFLSLAEGGDALRATPAHEGWLDRIEAEHDNLRAALAWAIARPEPEVALRLAAALWRFWSARGYWSEGRAWLDRALGCASGVATTARIAALYGAGTLASNQSDYATANRYHRESRALAERLGDERGAAFASKALGIVASEQGDLDEATALLDHALARFRALDEPAAIGQCLNDLGLVAERQGDAARGLALQEEALTIARSIGDHALAALLLGNLGPHYVEQGDVARGTALTEEALALSRLLGDTFGVAICLYNLGNVAADRGDRAAALAQYRESLALTRDVGETRLASRDIDRIAMALANGGDHRSAARLLAAAAGLRASVGDVLFAVEEAQVEGALRTSRAILGEASFAAAWAAGQAMTLEQAIAVALAVEPPREVVRLDLDAAGTSPVDVGLTERERAVLRLLVEGQSDKEIAAALGLTRRTASKYVSAILGKLDAPSRTAAATTALRGRLV